LTVSATRPVRGAHGAPRPGGPPRKSTRRDGIWPWLFVLPLFAGVVVFYLWPIAQTAYFSFTKWGAFGGSTWVGLDNYETLSQDGDVFSAIRNTLAYTVMILIGVPLAVWLATLLNRPGLRFAGLYKALFFMPYVALPTAIALVWRIIYNGDFGVLNWFLSLAGIVGPYWTSTPGIALVAVAVLGVWSSLGFNLIILSAGLKNIPAELYEAAQLDGASRTKQFFSITVPLLTPSIFFVTVITVIHGFQLFDLLFALLGADNPAMGSTQSLVFLFYSEAFVSNNKGYAAAIAMVILLLVGIFTAIQFRLQKKWVNYV
jgi:multiple sugar transport system permease protein